MVTGFPRALKLDGVFFIYTRRYAYIQFSVNFLSAGSFAAGAGSFYRLSRSSAGGADLYLGEFSENAFHGTAHFTSAVTFRTGSRAGTGFAFTAFA